MPGVLIVEAMAQVGGILMLMLGLVGEYVGRIYISINRSPQYVIRSVYVGRMAEQTAEREA